MPIRSNRNLTEYYDRFSYSGAGGPERVFALSMVGDRGLFMAGSTPSYVNDISYITIPTLGNGTDFGNLTEAIIVPGACSSEVGRGVRAGGYGFTNVIDYVTIANTGNATDFGDMSQSKSDLGCVSNGTRGILAGGAPSPTQGEKMDYITIANTGNSSDFGDITATDGKARFASVNNDTRGVFMGGDNERAPSNDPIDYITMATLGNSSNFGDILQVGNYPAGLSGNNDRGIAGGTYNPSTDIIQYITISTTGNAQDFGDLTSAKGGCYGVSNGTRGCYGGGSVIDYISTTTLGNAADFGDMLTSIVFGAGTSGD